MKRYLLVWGSAVLLTGFLLPGCGGRAKGPDIVCTTGMVADVVRNVAGDRYTIGQLMGEGVDPHIYDPTPADARALEGAKLIFYSGLHLEGKMGELFENMKKAGKPTFAIAEGVQAKKILPGEKGRPDPHVWFDVALWSETVDVVRDAMVEYDPAHAEEYRANAKTYRDRLMRLHEYAKQELAKVPKDRRVLVTAHDAFHYFGRAYDIEVKAIQGISTEDEAGVKQIRELVGFLTERRIKAVFVESSVPHKNLKALVEGCAKKGHEVEIGGE